MICLIMWVSPVTLDTTLCNFSLLHFVLYMQMKIVRSAFCYMLLIIEVEFFFAAPDLDQRNIYGVWKIDDTDNSFSSQTFRIKYARQDVHLCMMVSFILPRSRFAVMISLSFSCLYRNVKGRGNLVGMKLGLTVLSICQ